MRMPFCLVEKVAPVALLVTLRMKSPNFHSIARSESVGVGSIMSIVPLSATVKRMPENEQPAKLNCSESGTRSPSLFAGGSGPIAGQGPDDNEGLVAEPPISAANGVVLDSNVTLDARRSTSVVSSCAMSLASTREITCVGCVAFSHATATSNTAAAPASVRVRERVVTKSILVWGGSVCVVGRTR